MTEDELNRKMEFIIEQQAQFASDIIALRESQEIEVQARREQYQQLSEAIVGLVGMVGRIGEAQERTDNRVAELAEAQTKLAEAQARTEERLNIFINVVERHLGGNGTKPQDS